MCVAALGALMTPQLMISVAGLMMKQVSASQQNSAAIQQANEQNRIAKQNRIRKQTAEDYKILQIRKQKLSDIAAMELEGKQARATAFSQAETVSGVSVNRLMQDFFREEGRYKSQVLNNLESEAFSSQLNKEAYALNQEAQSKPVPHSNFLPTFAASSIAFAGDYYDWKTQQTQIEAAKKKAVFYGYD